MTRNTIDNHKLVKKPEHSDKPRSPRHDVTHPRKQMKRPHKKK